MLPLPGDGAGKGPVYTGPPFAVFAGFVGDGRDDGTRGLLPPPPGDPGDVHANGDDSTIGVTGRLGAAAFAADGRNSACAALDSAVSAALGG